MDEIQQRVSAALRELADSYGWPSPFVGAGPDAAAGGQRRPVGDVTARPAEPSLVPYTAVASGSPDQHLVRSQRVPIRAARRRQRHPTVATPDQFADLRHNTED